MPHDVFLATCTGATDPDPDRVPTDAALLRAGVAAGWPAWNDPGVDWSAASVVYPRVTWDYFRDLPGFLRWVEAVDAVTTLRNPAAVIRWNVDKRYMLELAEAGIRCVPTCVVATGATVGLDDVRSQRRWGRVVIKPAVSAGSWHTYALGADEDAEELWRGLVAERDMLVQPFVASVETTGERCAIVIDGELTHVVRKNPRFEGGTESVTGPFEPSDAERALVARVLEHVGVDLDYARVDMVTDDNGRPMIAELELIEPSLFFKYSEVAVGRFVAMVQRHIQQS